MGIFLNWDHVLTTNSMWKFRGAHFNVFLQHCAILPFLELFAIFLNFRFNTMGILHQEETSETKYSICFFYTDKNRKLGSLKTENAIFNAI